MDQDAIQNNGGDADDDLAKYKLDEYDEKSKSIGAKSYIFP